MDVGIGAIIFIVFVVISIAQKIKEHADLARAKRQQPQSRPGEMSERAQSSLPSLTSCADSGSFSAIRRRQHA